jgi:hypothetical protein
MTAWDDSIFYGVSLVDRLDPKLPKTGSGFLARVSPSGFDPDLTQLSR